MQLIVYETKCKRLCAFFAISPEWYRIKAMGNVNIRFLELATAVVFNYGLRQDKKIFFVFVFLMGWKYTLSWKDLDYRYHTLPVHI